ncbi:MAG: hypothetical protein WA089_00185 [Anaerolineae bacterium]
MTTTEAAATAGRTKTTIRNWIQRGRLEASIKQTDGPPGFAWDITPEALTDAIAAQRRPGRPYKNPKPQNPEAQEAEERTP